MAIHRTLSGIVGCQRKPQVATKAFREVPQILHPTLQILAWVKGIGDTVALRRSWNQLHQALRTFGRDRLLLVVTLHLHHGMNECGIHPMPLRGLVNHLADD